MLKSDPWETGYIPQERDTNTRCANCFAVAKSLPDVLNSSPVLSQLVDMMARGNKEGIKERRALSFEVMISLDSRPLGITASSLGMDFATVWTNYESLGICAGQRTTHSVYFVEIEIVRDENRDPPPSNKGFLWSVVELREGFTRLAMIFPPRLVRDDATDVRGDFLS